MDSRENILEAIKKNQPQYAELPEIDLNAVIHYDDIAAQFKTTLEGIGGKVEFVDDITVLKNKLAVEKSAGEFVLNAVELLGATDKQAASFSATQLEKLERVYIKGTVAVAENGAVWIYESQMINRLLPFICQHLVLVVDKKDIVATMHHGYQKIDVAKEGFGVFIAGPSKTADIEQSLVIGAHGARTATIYILN